MWGTQRVDVKWRKVRRVVESASTSVLVEWVSNNWGGRDETKGIRLKLTALFGVGDDGE
jgi:hypothetical protein